MIFILPFLVYDLFCSRSFYLCPIWFVLFLVCALFGLCSFWFVLFLVCALFGSSCFSLWLFLVCALFGTCPLWFMPFLVCALFGSCCFVSCSFWFVLFFQSSSSLLNCPSTLSVLGHFLFWDTFCLETLFVLFGATYFSISLACLSKIDNRAHHLC